MTGRRVRAWRIERYEDGRWAPVADARIFRDRASAQLWMEKTIAEECAISRSWSHKYRVRKCYVAEEKIGDGHDFSSLSAWEAASDGDLTTENKMKTAQIIPIDRPAQEEARIAVAFPGLAVKCPHCGKMIDGALDLQQPEKKPKHPGPYPHPLA